mmetsp:Transcript_75481/g.230864  ORF Transcript_75481/g.230864 Transcript_75481/m.230864 type:complete len:275 (+) Transcript_75481:366-1190(+)
MHPRPHPQDWLRDPMLPRVHVLLLALLLPHGPLDVGQAPLGHEVDVRRLLAGQEDAVVGRDGHLRHRGRREALHRDGTHLTDVVEQGVDLEVRHGHSALQLALQLFGQHRQDGHAGMIRGTRLLLPGVLQVTVDAQRQQKRHLILPQIPAQLPELLGGLFLHGPELRERSRDASDNVRESHEGEHHDAHGVQALAEVLRLDVHRRRGELRQGPVERRGVRVLPRRIIEIVHLNPSVDLGLVGHGDKPPTARDEMIDDQKQNNHLDDVCDDAGEL